MEQQPSGVKLDGHRRGEVCEAQQVRVSQGGLISKIEVDIVLAKDVPENGLAFDLIDKIHEQACA